MFLFVAFKKQWRNSQKKNNFWMGGGGDKQIEILNGYLNYE